ncbi:hypothetical protein LCGC14_2513860 [marine sediment metagenome]|uniref:Methyltransferase small domain-containing protein n=1 Tax=marine sediment metagenome TaxID=412755 RepID=A0A0F9AYV2_9ZZZZ
MSKLPQNVVSSDDFQTPPHAINPLLPYLSTEWIIWECATGNGNLERALKAAGYSCYGTDIIYGQDFLATSVTARGYERDCIVTNPPYSLKNEFLEQFVEYKTVGNVQTVIPHPFKIRAAAIRKCIVTAPFKTDSAALNEIEDFKMLDKVWTEIEKFNEMGEEVKKN